MAINIRATLDRGEADIQVVNETHGGLRYFKPLSDSAREWMQDNLSDGEHLPERRAGRGISLRR